MIKKISALALCLLVSNAVYALDSNRLGKALNNYAKAISHTAYNAVECDKNNNDEYLNEAFERAEKAANALSVELATISNESDIEKASEIINKFAKKSDLNSKTADMAKRMLKERANFLIASGKEINEEANVKLSVSRSAQAPVSSEKLLKRHQKRLIMIETPNAEAIVTIEDGKKNRRVDNFEQILKRHGCVIISSYKNEDESKYSYYFSGRKYVIDTLLNHFDGSVVNADLRAYVQITTGGFWGGKKKHMFSVGPKRSDRSTMGELSWYKSVVQHDPIAYFSANAYEELAELGSIENVAGAKKLHLKNVKAEIWVSAGDKSEKEAVYHTKLELGDKYIDAK